MHASYAFLGNPFPAGPLEIAAKRIHDPGLEIITDNSEPCLPGRNDIPPPVRTGGIRVVDDHALGDIEAGTENRGFPATGFEHVQVDAVVRLEESLLVEGRLSCSGDTDENDQFHVRSG